MSEEIINIATLTIDKTEANKSIVETKTAIFELQKANSELRKDIQKNGDVTGEQTKKFVENEAQLKTLTAQYRTQQAAINDVTLAEIKNSKALTDSVKTIDQANAQNKELLKTRNQIDASSKEGAQAIALLNAKMDENKKFIVENGNAQEKAANITGNYRQYMFGLGDSFDKARNIVTGFTSTVSQASNDVTNMTNSVIQSTKATLGFKTSSQLAAQSQAVQTATTEIQTVANEALTVSQEGVTVATTATSGAMKVLKLAIIATGIGALIILGVALFTALKNNESASNKFAKSLAGIKGIVNAVMSVLVPLGSFLIDKIGAAFEFVGAAAEKGMRLVSKGLALIGFDKAAKSVDNFTNSVKGSIQNTQRLADAEAKYNDQKRLSTKIQLDFQKQAEKLRQIRDDESKGTAARIKANEQLGATLKKQQGAELSIANQALAIANLRIKLEGKSKDNLDARAEALTTVSDIQERISGQESEQLANLNSLRKEAADKEKERRARAIEQQKKQLETTRLVFEAEVSTTEEKLKFYETYYAKLNVLEGGANKVKNAQDLSSKILEIAKGTIDGEIELQTKKIEANKTLDAQQRADLLANAEFLRAEQTKRVEETILSEVDKAAALAEIQKGYLESVKTINQEFADGEKARAEEAKTLAALDAELRLLTLQEQGYSESQLKLAILKEQYDEEARLRDEALAAGDITQKEAIAKKLINDKKYAQATAALDKELAKTKRAAAFGVAQDAIAAAQSIFGESKALAVASALINTYQGITAELSTKAITPYEIGLKVANVAIVAANGFAAVKNILKTDKGSGASGGGPGSSGGSTSTPAAVFENPARTQTVASVNAAPAQPNDPISQPVLILETLSEAQKNQLVKINSK